MMKILVFFCFLLPSCCTPQRGEIEKDTLDPNWTMMFYLGANNNLEYELLRNIRDLKLGYQGGCNVIILIDRSEKYSSNTSITGEDFSGCRIYQMKKGGRLILQDSETLFLKELKGDVRASDIQVLKYFIEYGKKRFPAKHYALFLGSHGGGARSTGSLQKSDNVIYSEDTDDWIYTHEFTDILGDVHSVDLLAIDACFMGNLEFLYQIRQDNNGFHADYVVASPPTEWSYGWDYQRIFSHISDGGSMKEGISAYLSSDLTPHLFGKLLIETHYSYMEEYGMEDQVLSFYDMSKITAVKETLDELFVMSKEEREQMETIRGKEYLSQDTALLYFDSYNPSEWLSHCYFDVYDFADRIVATDLIPDRIKMKAEELKEKVDEVVLYSFSGNYFRRFIPDVHGLSFFFPDGNRAWEEGTMWEQQTWYNANPTTNGGSLDFCRDGAIAGNGKVENYFEVLDAWFDKEDGAGGVNGYSY